FTDEQGVVLDPSFVTFQSTNPSAAKVSAQGLLVGLSNGTSILTASAGGLQAATVVAVGLPQDALSRRLYDLGLDLYPQSVALSGSGGTRQTDVHPGQDVELTTDLSHAASGTRYFLSRPGVVTVSADGLLTAVAPGTVTVTIINGATDGGVVEG